MASTAGLNNAILLEERKVSTTSNLDEFHLQRLAGPGKPTDLGILDIWAMTRSPEAPLLHLALSSGVRTVVVENNDGAYTYKHPVAYELPIVVDDIEPTNLRKGIDGQKFKVKFNKPEFGHGDVITYDKFSGKQFVVTEDEIIPSGDHYIYTLRPLNQTPYDFLDNRYVQAGVRWFRLFSAVNEYSKRYPSMYTEAGYRTYINWVGDVQAAKEMHVTEKAALLNKYGIYSDGGTAVVETFWAFKDGVLDPSIRSLNDLKRKYGKEILQQLRKEGKASVGFLTKLESQMLKEVARDIENNLMWGRGGLLTTDGVKQSRLSVGLWPQLNNAYTRIYTRDNFSIDLLREAIYNFFIGREKFDKPDPDREIIFMTGMGGARLFQKAIDNVVATSGLQIQAADKYGIGALSGKATQLSYGIWFERILIPFIGWVKVVINPAFDNIQINTIENPIISGTGLPLSSFLFVAFDVTDKPMNENLVLLKRHYDPGTQLGYINGTFDYLGRPVVQSAGQFSGFKLWMKQYVPTLHLLDPTRVMKISMKNPVTGGNL